MTQLPCSGAGLALLLLVATPAFAQEAWQLQHPSVLATFEAIEEPQFHQAVSVGFCWTNDRPVLGVKHTDGENIRLHLYAEVQHGEWKPLATLDKLIGPPRLISLGRDIGVITAIRGTTKQPAGCVMFYRLSPTGDILTKLELINAPGFTGSWHVSAAEVSGSQIVVLAEHHPPSDGEKKLYLVQSGDLGRSWEAFNPVGKSQYPGINMLCIPTLVAQSNISFYQWEFARPSDQLKVFRQASTDGGATWNRSPVAFKDNLGIHELRIPLFGHQQANRSWMVYASISMQDANNGRFYLTQSSDQGQTWQLGQPLTKAIKLEESTLNIQLASSPAGALRPARLAFAYSGFDENSGVNIEQASLIVSHNDGKDWQTLDLDSYYHGHRLHPVVTLSPSGDRLLFGSSICIHPELDRRNFVVVQEYSPRRTTESDLFSSTQQTQIFRWLRDLSDDQFDLRQTATQRLIDLGPSIRNPLLNALHSTHDPEVRRRLTLILSKVYPPCLKVR